MKLILTCWFLAIMSLVSAKDPFLSPFEPVITVKKEQETLTNREKKIEDKDQIKLLKEIEEIESSMRKQQLTEAKKNLDLLAANPLINTHNFTEKIKELETELENYKSIQEKLKSIQDLMDVQGKVLLNSKKNLLMINGQAASEGDEISEILKTEEKLYLYEVKEDSYSIRKNNVSIEFQYK